MSTLSVSNITDGTDTVETGYVVNGSAKGFFSSYEPGVVNQSLNISSSVDHGNGYHGVSFTSTFADAHYASPSSAAWRRSEYSTSISSSGIRYYCTDPNASESTTVNYTTAGGLTAAYFGDLA